jgi:hypothetical protein
MGLYIRDDRVRDMAKRLAEAERVTVTEAVRQALEKRLKELEDDRAQRDRDIRQIWAELDAMPTMSSMRAPFMMRSARQSRPSTGAHHGTLHPR